jgi:hypothetical protein
MAHSTLTFSGISKTSVNALESGRTFHRSRLSLTSALNLPSVPLALLPRSFWLQRLQLPSMTPMLSLSIPLMRLHPIRHGLPLFIRWPTPLRPLISLPLLPPLTLPLLLPLPPLLPLLPLPLTLLPTQNHWIP